MVYYKILLSIKSLTEKMNSFNVEVRNNKTGKMEKITGLEYAKQAYNQFYDEMARALISSNSYIRDASGTQFKRRPFFELYDKARKTKINLVDIL